MARSCFLHLSMVTNDGFDRKSTKVDNAVEMRAFRSMTGVTDGYITEQCDKRALRCRKRCSDENQERDG